MILGLSTANFTLLHVVISLVAIASGLVVVLGMLQSQRMPGWTLLFLVMTILTSVTGFLFPIHGFTPALGLGTISLLLLLVTVIALYAKHLDGRWRWIYVVTALVALYLNVAVLIIQSFQKLSVLNPAAQVVGPPFAGDVNTHFMIAQAVVLLLFLVFGTLAALKFRPAPSLS